jgi:hypothetical protein
MCWGWMEGRGTREGKGEAWLIDTLRINVYMLVFDRWTTALV